MRIMVVSINAWDDTNSFGNTVSNFFGGWEDAELFSLYFRGAPPRNSVCTRYFKISEKMMLKAFLNKEESGKYFEADAVPKADDINKKEKKFIAFLHKYKIEWLKRGFDLLWERKNWQNEKFKAAIREFSPEIVFAFAKADAQYYYTLEYISKNTDAKIVLFCADDVYSVYKNMNNRYGNVLMERFRNMMGFAHGIYGISPQMCEFYGKEFGKNITRLQKGCTEFSPVKEDLKSATKLVYAGNLLYGRLEILCRIADVVKKIYDSGFNVEFEVYSGDVISKADRERLENPCTRFMGSRMYCEIEKILSQSHIVIHAESFDKDQIEKVKYSFSTKIIDCIKCGSVLMVVGPEGIASVECARKIPGVCVIDKKNEIEQEIEKLLKNRENLRSMALATQNYAMENYHIDVVRKQLLSDFDSLLER